MKYQLHTDAAPVPKGMKPKPGVEYGCGEKGCTRCYEPIQPESDSTKKEPPTETP